MVDVIFTILVVFTILDGFLEYDAVYYPDAYG